MPEEPGSGSKGKAGCKPISIQHTVSYPVGHAFYAIHQWPTQNCQLRGFEPTPSAPVGWLACLQEAPFLPPLLTLNSMRGSRKSSCAWYSVKFVPTIFDCKKGSFDTFGVPEKTVLIVADSPLRNRKSSVLPLWGSPHPHQVKYTFTESICPFPHCLVTPLMLPSCVWWELLGSEVRCSTTANMTMCKRPTRQTRVTQVQVNGTKHARKHILHGCYKETGTEPPKRYAGSTLFVPWRGRPSWSLPRLGRQGHQGCQSCADSINAIFSCPDLPSGSPPAPCPFGFRGPALRIS